MKRWQVTMFPLGFLVAAAAAQARAEPAAEAEKEAAFAKIEYDRSGGFAGLAVSMTIDAAGHVQVQTGAPGNQKEPPPASAKPHLEKPELAKLKELVKAVNWEKVKPAYKSSQPVPDGFHYHLSVARSGKTYKTGIDAPIDLPVPKALAALNAYLGKLLSKYQR
jgi:hypothetical protein